MRSLDTDDGDRTARARIRNAAIRTIADRGPSALTARRVAAAAGTSPALVIHHYGSMDSLRQECDQYVVGEIRRLKTDALSQGPQLDLVSALRRGHPLPLARYLAEVLAEDSPAVAELVDELVADAQEYTEQAVTAGMLRPTEYPQGRAAVLMLWGLGALVLHRHVQRLLGADPTDADFGRSPASANYIGPVYEIYSHGLFGEAFAAQASAAATALADDNQQEETQP